MSQNYLNVGRFYTLTSTVNISITGASLIHGIYNAANANIVVTVDGKYNIHVAADQSVNFINPVSFKTLKTSAATATGIILYS